MSMHAIRAVRVHQYGGPEQLRLERIQCPEPQAGEVLMRVRAAAVHAADWKIRQGLFKDFRPMQFPYIPGQSVSGTVEEVGPGVVVFQKGQVVFGQSAKGAYAEYIAAPVDTLALKPESLSFDEAATITGGATTAWQALFEHGRLQSGQHVLVLGAAGGVGLYAVQLARWKGAQVIGTTSTANMDFVRSLGAETVIDYTSTPFEQIVRDVDLVLDTVGGETLERSWRALKPGGTLISIVSQPSSEKAQALGVHAAFFIGRTSRELLQAIVQLIDEGQVKAVVAQSFPLNEAHKAHEFSQSGHGRGRIVLCVSD